MFIVELTVMNMESKFIMLLETQSLSFFRFYFLIIYFFKENFWELNYRYVNYNWQACFLRITSRTLNNKIHKTSYEITYI